MFFIIKIIVSGVIIAVISSMAKAFPKWAALLTALPLMTYLSLVWIYIEHKDLGLLETYTRDVFIWVLPGLAFFAAALFLFRARVPFFVTMALSTLALAGGVWIFNRFGILK